MTMEREFFPVKPLIHDRLFLVSFLTSLAVALLIGVLVAQFIAARKITVSPIAEVSFVPSPSPSKLASVKPISEISQVKAETGKHDKQVLAAWVVALDDFCRLGEDQGDNKRAFVLVEEPNGQVMAATSKIGEKTCRLARNLPSDETILVASDTPFRRVNSEQRFVTVDFPK